MNGIDESTTSRDGPRCPYCGIELTKKNTSQDHIPPKSIFKPRPLDTITVRCCDKCNGGANRDDEAFKVAIGLQLGQVSSPLQRAQIDSVKRTLSTNKRLVRDIMTRSVPIWHRGTNGIIVPTLAYLWNDKSFENTISRLTQGLFFHVTGQSLFGLGAVVSPKFFGSKDPGLALVSGARGIRSIGDRRFRYSFAIGEDRRKTVWVFEFYEKFYAGAVTAPA